MKVDLIWVTPDPEGMIAYIARVSNEKNQNNPDYAKLIKYLIKNKHWSPFEMSSMCFRIETSRAIAQQILRHRSFSFQELSQRYTEVDKVEPIELRKQAEKNRQSSTEVFDPMLSFDGFYTYATNDVERKNMIPATIAASERISVFLNNALALYNELIDAGVAKECARMVLPLATQTTIYITGSCRSWIHYLQLRNDEHTQKEHQLIAQQIEEIFALYYPCTYEALQSLKKEQEDKELLYKLLQEGVIHI